MRTVTTAISVGVLLTLATACGGGNSSSSSPEIEYSTPPPTAYTIGSSSMEPTLHCAKPSIGCEATTSDQAVVHSASKFDRGDIVLFYTPAGTYAKCGVSGKFIERIVGLPSEVVELRIRNGDGYVYIDGKELEEPYIEKARRGAVQKFGPYAIPRDAYFTMGDNRWQSCDSRMWGSAPASNMIGKVTKIIRAR